MMKAARLRTPLLTVVASAILLWSGDPAAASSSTVAPSLPGEAAISAATPSEAPAQHPATVELRIPQPDLSNLAPVARRKIETMQEAVEEVVASRDQGATPPVPLARALGFLGQMYHAFDLLAAAEDCYGQAGLLAPDDPTWPYLRGLARHALGEYAGAVEDYRAAVALSPGEAAPGLRLGQALLELDRREEARQAFEAVVAGHGDSAAAHFGLGRAAADPERAVEYFEKALELDSAASAVHYPLAQAYRRLGRQEDARRHLARQGSREPSFPDPMAGVVAQIQKGVALEVLVELASQTESFDEESFLGFATSQVGPSAAAASALRQVLQEIPRDEASASRRGRLHAALGTILARLGHDEEAATELGLALELEPGLRASGRELGDVLARLERWQEAGAAYSRALGEYGRDPELLSRRALARARAGLLPAARADLERLVALEPEEIQHRVRLASVLARQEEPAAAREVLEEAVAENAGPRERAAAQVALGDLHRAVGDVPEAIAAYAAAVASEPAAAPAHLALAGMQARQGRYREAADAYRRLLEIDPEHTAARVGQVTALIFLGEHREAVESLEEGLRLMPDELDFKDILARHLAACPDPAVRDGARALELALDLFQAVPSTESAETLAMAYAEAGDFREAVRWQRELVEQLADEVDPETVERWERHLSLYERGEACCG